MNSPFQVDPAMCRAPIVACVLVIPALLFAGDDVTDDEKKLQGIWRVVASIDNGVKEPDDDSVEIFIDGNLIKVREEDTWISQYFIKLVPDKSPRAMDLRFVRGKRKGETNLGIYELNDKSLKICIQEMSDKGRPTAFESRKGSGTKLILLKKI